MADVFKVWIQVERCNDERDEYENVTEPDCIAELLSEGEAQRFAADLVRLFEIARIHEREHKIREG